MGIILCSSFLCRRCQVSVFWFKAAISEPQHLLFSILPVVERALGAALGCILQPKEHLWYTVHQDPLRYIPAPLAAGCNSLSLGPGSSFVSYKPHYLSAETSLCLYQEALSWP